jgi:protein-disulfide isomerase
MNVLRRVLLLFAAAFLVAAPAATRPPAHHRRHAPIDWTRTVVATPDGGFRVGNPQAKVAVVEFMSFTCPHCAAFSAEGFPAIRDKYVRSGKLSFEMRSALRDRADLVAATISHCAGPQHFFAMAEALFAAQSDWETRAIEWDSGHPPSGNDAADAAEMTAFAAGAGLDAIARQHGVPIAALPACFANKSVRADITRTTADAWGTRKINGTPGFLINGTVTDGVHSWSMLEPLLQSAING